MTAFEQPRRMSICVAGGYNNLLLEPPLPDEVFANLLPPSLIGKSIRAALQITQYGNVYTALGYRQLVETVPTASPVAYGGRVCEYLGKLGVTVEFDEHVYGVSPQTLFMMATEPAPAVDVQIRPGIL